MDESDFYLDGLFKPVPECGKRFSVLWECAKIVFQWNIWAIFGVLITSLLIFMI
jgi:hypothetical protein